MVALALGSISLRAEEAETKPSPVPPILGSLSGRVEIELRNDLKQALPDLKMALCPESIGPEIKRVREERWRETAKLYAFNDGYNNLDLKTIGATAVEAAVATFQSDKQGNFSRTGIPAGKYLLYAQYKSKYAAAYWLVPVEIKAGEEASLVLTNGNMKEIYNRFQ